MGMMERSPSDPEAQRSEALEFSTRRAKKKKKKFEGHDSDSTRWPELRETAVEEVEREII